MFEDSEIYFYSINYFYVTLFGTVRILYFTYHPSTYVPEQNAKVVIKFPHEFKHSSGFFQFVVSFNDTLVTKFAGSFGGVFLVRDFNSNVLGKAALP